MGDSYKENEHIAIPMADHESSNQASLPSENANPEIVLDTPSTDQPTPTADAPSTAEPPPAADEKAPKANESKTCPSAAEDVCLFVVVVILFIIVVPLFLLYALGAYLLCNKDVTEETPDKDADATEPKKQGQIYRQVQDFRGTAFYMAKMISVIHSRLMILLLTWLVINLSVKSLRRKIILGSHLWQWTLVVVIASCGYPVIDMVMSLILHYFTKIYKNRKDAVYYARGLKTSFNLIIFTAMLFLTWHFYFRSRYGLRKISDTEWLFHLVRWTLVSLIIFSICWLFKNILLLKWKAHAIYNRFSKRILRTGLQLYFLGLISGTPWDIFKPRKMGEMVENGKKENGEKAVLENSTMKNVEARTREESEEKKKLDKDNKVLKPEPNLERKGSIEKADEENSKKERGQEKKIDKYIKDLISSKDLMITYQLKRKAKVFIHLAKVSSRDEEEDISHTLEDVRQKFTRNFPRDHEYTVKDLSQIFEMDEQEAELLYAEVQDEHPSGKVSIETFKKWMVRAHKNCSALGYTLIDAKEVVNCLNIVMILVVILVVVFSWLFLMEIATTKLLVLITSPLLAATYIFSDSCKMFFEGVIFAFVRHPFDVGDRCLIDEIEMEVKRISILTTSFLKISGGEEAIYPNSVLVTKTIVNLKGEPDPNDCIELTLAPTTVESQISNLLEKITEFIKQGHADDCHFIVKGIGNVIRVGVFLKYKMSMLDVTHSQCFEAKNRQRSELLLEIKRILEQLEIQTI